MQYKCTGFVRQASRTECRPVHLCITHLGRPLTKLLVVLHPRLPAFEPCLYRAFGSVLALVSFAVSIHAASAFESPNRFSPAPRILSSGTFVRGV